MNKILTIQDYSCLGNCSGQTFNTICPMMNTNPVLVPTMLYSQHTGMGKKRVKYDLTAFLKQALKEIDVSDIDICHIGFLSANTFKPLTNFIKQNSNKYFLIDPCLTDDGKYYDGKGNKDLKKYKKLIKHATLITPNFYEACMLVGIKPKKATKELLLRKFEKAKIKNYLLKGFVQEDKIVNILKYDDKLFEFAYDEINGVFQGCGDVLNAIIVSKLANGARLEDAVKIGLDYVNESIKVTDSTTQAYGISYDVNLKNLK